MPAITEAAPARKHVFISYATLDKVKADRIVEALERLGQPCWISWRDIPLGGDFQREIVVAIESAGAMLLLLSRNSSASKEIPKETSIASDIGRLIIPLRLDDAGPGTALRYQVTSAQWIDLSTDFDARIKELAGRLARQLDPAKAGQRHVETKRPVPTGIVAALVFAGLAVAALFAWPVLRPSVESFMQARKPASARIATSRPAPSQAVAPRAVDTPETRVQAFVESYYQAMSGPAEPLLNFLQQKISDPIEFYGRPLPRRVLLAQQSAYLQRWPERHFTIEPGSLTVNCAVARCSASGLIDYSLRSYARHVATSGTERFDLQIQAGTISLLGISTIPIEKHENTQP